MYNFIKYSCILFLLFKIGSINVSAQTQQNSGTTNVLRSIYFLDENQGWVVGDSCTILKTINGGDTWQKQEYSGTETIKQIKFFNDSIGWLIESHGDNGGMIKKTIDGGLTWIIKFTHDNNVNEFYFFSPDTGWIGGTRFVKKTFDGGESWISIEQNVPSSSAPFQHFYSTFFLNMSVGWVANMYSDGMMNITEDGGDTWSTYDDYGPDIPTIDDLKFINNNTGAALTSYLDFNDNMKLKSELLTTINSGTNWTTIYNHNTYLLDIFQFDSNNCWVVGYDGTIIKFSLDSMSVGFDNHLKNDIPEKMNLMQNYPNPFNPSTTIRYSLPRLDFVSLSIYNIVGQEIETLVYGYRQAGEHEITWQPKGLPSGIYFYRLQAGEFLETKKLLLQK